MPIDHIGCAGTCALKIGCSSNSIISSAASRLDKLLRVNEAYCTDTGGRGCCLGTRPCSAGPETSGGLGAMRPHCQSWRMQTCASGYTWLAQVRRDLRMAIAQGICCPCNCLKHTARACLSLLPAVRSAKHLHCHAWAGWLVCPEKGRAVSCALPQSLLHMDMRLASRPLETGHRAERTSCRAGHKGGERSSW